MATPNAPSIIQNMASIFPKAVLAAIALTPNELIAEVIRRLEIVYNTL